jgi:hypothetical protein
MYTHEKIPSTVWDLDAVPEQVQKYFLEQAANGTLNLGWLGSHNWLWFTCLNFKKLQRLGLAEQALLDSFIATNINNRNIAIGIIEYLFQECSKTRLRELSDPMPGAGPFTIYRGLAGPRGRRQVRGYSWTGNLPLACWYASRFSKLADPAVYVATVENDQVLAYLNESHRNEMEFVCRPLRPRRMKLDGEEIKTLAAKPSQQEAVS